MEFIQGCKGSSTLTNQQMLTNHINRMKYKNLHKSPPQTCPHDKNCKLDTGGTCFKIIKSIHDKMIVNITPSREKLKAFPFTSVTRQRCPLLPLLFNSTTM